MSTLSLFATVYWFFAKPLLFMVLPTVIVGQRVLNVSRTKAAQK